MEKPRVLSGDVLVAKGITKIDASLPEVGLKDVTPNGSWLEQKQIQAALEARKHLIEIERIEKCGTLSHAEWRDDLMLAEVTQKAGGHWQYLGHNVGKTLYLRPEEALFLMEVNCLLLKHNEVTVSLQKAYSLLLCSPNAIIQYKVYASLSRLGYRVFRHSGPKVNDEKKESNQKVNKIDSNGTIPKNNESKHSDPPTTDLSRSERVDSPVIAVNITEKVDSPTISILNESENDQPTVSTIEPVNNLSVVSTVNDSGNVILPIVATITESEKEYSSVPMIVVDSVETKPVTPVDNTVKDVTVTESEKEDSSVSNIVVDSMETEPDTSVDNTVKDATVTESEKEDSSVGNTVVESMETEPKTQIDNVVGDSKTDNTPITKTVPDSEIVDLPKVESGEKSENHDTLMADKVSENEQEQTIDQVEANSNEVSGNAVETSNIVKASEEIAEKFVAENSLVKETEPPKKMEVDDITEMKTTDNKTEIETSQEVSSILTEIDKNVEKTTESMEMCNENPEAGIRVMKESDHRSNGIEAMSVEETNSMVTSDVSIDMVKVIGTNDDADASVSVTGTETIDDSTNCLENIANNKHPSNTDICPSTEKMIEKVYFNKQNDSNIFLSKIEKLMKRQFKPCDSKAMDKFFENIPDLSKERIATINVPEQQFIPKNIFVNKGTYTLDFQNIKMRTARSISSESTAYTSSDEVSGTNIRRIRSSLEVLGPEYPQNQNFNPHGRFQNFPRYQHFRPYGFWRPQNNINFYQLMFFQTRFQYLQRPHLLLRPPCFNIPPNNINISNSARKRMRNGKFAHFQGIRNLAVRLKQSLISGNTDMSNLGTLHGLLHSYNLRYKARLRLTENFDVINDEKIVETIDLDDDEESNSKKRRVEKDDDDKFDENLYRLRQFALRLRDLEAKDKATASHRRAFSKAIKTFNKSYNADIYLDDVNYEVIDRRFITLDSSSESDCVVEQPKIRSKKLRNPFNILKRRKERMLSQNNPGTSKDDNCSDSSQNDAGPSNTDEDNNTYSDIIRKIFNEAWLPNEQDFGRAEVVPKRFMNSRLELSNKEQLLYEYKNDQFENWLEIKIAFLRYLEAANNAFKREQARMIADVEMCNSGLKPLVDFEDGSDMPSLLEKLRIIENNKEIDIETSLRIDFDVYNRNVQNFRKRNPPKPHFRIICLDESSGVPSAAHVMSLHSKYDDNVPIVFAIVSIGSISYLQINPIDLPIYVPTSNDVV